MPAYPAISGVTDASQTRIALIQGNQLVSAPLNVVIAALTGLYQPADPTLTFLAAGFVGVVLDYAGTTAPGGFLLCFGQSLLRTDYPALFAVIGTTYGAADGTHFNVPDYRGRIGAGQDDMGGTSANRLTAPLDGDTLGAVGGAETVTLAIANMPAHDHGGTTGNEAAHTHTIPGSLTVGASASIQRTAAGSSPANFPTSAGSAHSHTISSQGSGTPATIVQPTIVINKIIYAGV